MKKIFFLFLTVLVSVQALHAQGSMRDKLRDKLRIFYVVNANLPASASGNVVQLNTTEIHGGICNGAMFSNANTTGFVLLVKGLLCDGANGGDANMQAWAGRIISIRNDIVNVYLVDDITNPITNWTVADANYGSCQQATSNWAWPCAFNYASNPSTDPSAPTVRGFAGQLCIGAYYCARYGVRGARTSALTSEKKATFLHELTHTQDNSSGREHLFWIGPTWYGYGADGTHYWTEIFPNYARAYQEALANMPAIGYDHGFRTMAYDIFKQQGHFLIELPPNPAGTGEIWFVNELRSKGVREVRTIPVGTSTYYEFRYQDLPPKYIVQNECVLGMILYQCRLHMDRDPFWAAINSGNGQLFRVSSWPVAIMFRELCRSGLTPGRSESTLLTSVAGGNEKHLFPLALADYFTNFRSTTKAQFGDIFENGSILQNYIDAYWINRETVRTAAGTTRDEASLTRIKRALNF